MVEAYENRAERRFPSDAEWTKIMQTAAHVWKSGMAKDYGLLTESAAILVMLKGWELGLGLMASLDHIRIVHGRPSPSAECMEGLARAKVRGVTFTWLTTGADGTATVRAFRPGHESVEVTYTKEDAERGGVYSRNQNYGKWPAAMFRAGAMRQVVRLLFSDILLGFDDVFAEEQPAPALPPTQVPARALASTPAEVPALSSSVAKRLAVQGESRPEPAALPPAPPVVESKPEPISAPGREPGDDEEEYDERAPMEPEDKPFPFTTGTYAGKRLSDLSRQADFRRLYNGYIKAAADAHGLGNTDLAAEKREWAGRVADWADYRRVELGPEKTIT
jgi:hypothetical protein